MARTSSFGSGNGSPLLPPGSASSVGSAGSGSPLHTGSGPSSAGSASSVKRQGSQGSIFEQFASQAKELVRETTRQSSQDGLLAQMDKVRLNEDTGIFERGFSFVKLWSLVLGTVE